MILCALLASAAPAQPVATSPDPDSVAVTVYRAPGRAPGEKLNLRWLNGFALITETRSVSIPAGDSTLRFEGVAGGIVPESAIVTGLPAGVVEKNQDAFLLSPASLLDAALGRRVHIRRTSRETGIVSETEAVIRSGKDGAVVLETPAGIEALRCTGLNETLIYESVPDGLVARPTLSVRVRGDAPAEAIVTLSYLATGFDWQSDYVAELSADGRRMDLFAWLTLANGDETGFRNADTNAVAGGLNRQETERRRPVRAPIQLQCWPQGTTTSDLLSSVAPPPPPPPPPPMMDIVVTGSRVGRANLEMAAPVIMAQQEELGDLKLYRVPEPVTVAANSQKQVALLERSGVPVEIVYRLRIGGEGEVGAAPVLVTRNRESERLGLALPQGSVALFQRLGDRRVLTGRGGIRDLAVGEDVEIVFGPSIDVQVRVVQETREEDGGGRFLLTVTNAKDRPVRFEGELEAGGRPASAPGVKLGKRDGRPLWAATVPANGSRTLRYEVE